MADCDLPQESLARYERPRNETRKRDGDLRCMYQRVTNCFVVAGHARPDFLMRYRTAAVSKRLPRFFPPSWPRELTHRSTKHLLIQLLDMVAEILDDAGAPYFHGGCQ